ncbi:MAG: carbon-monoxide dehydrogenase medium subunit [Candidatus Poriferisodalaceae bacterium]|jgi:carbon-monoxide dehydrogenase medium subunit
MTFTVPSMADSGFVSRSHRAIAPFVLHSPATAADAASLLASGAIAHAGGIDVVSRLRQGATAESVVRLSGIDELGRIEITAECLIVGAGVTHAEVESNPIISDVRPDLAAAWRTVGNLRIRRTGTVGGNLMAFDGTYDAAPILAAAEARLVFVEPDRTLSESNVVDRPSSGLLLRLEIPLAGQVVFDRSLKPVVTVAVGDRYVAVSCAHETPIVLSREWFDHTQLPDPINDAYASASYRRRMIGVLTERAIRKHELLDSRDQA